MEERQEMFWHPVQFSEIKVRVKTQIFEVENPSQKPFLDKFRIDPTRWDGNLEILFCHNHFVGKFHETSKPFLDSDEFRQMRNIKSYIPRSLFDLTTAE